MVLLPLTPGVRPSDAGKVSPVQAKSNAEKAQKRDDYTCRFCGFRSKQYQRTMAWPGAGEPPVVTVCTFCEQVLNLERGGVTGAGILLWLPEISQVDLHHLLRAIYVARADKNGPMADLATRALDALTVRRSEAKKRLGSDDPLLLATLMRESLNDDEAHAAVKKIEGIRLLPSEKYMMRGSKGDANQFPQIVKFWVSAAGPFAKVPTSGWQELFTKAAATPVST